MRKKYILCRGFCICKPMLCDLIYIDIYITYLSLSIYIYRESLAMEYRHLFLYNKYLERLGEC